jgi:transcriptional regulator with GAF, ATPase, and Fis domain
MGQAADNDQTVTAGSGQADRDAGGARAPVAGLVFIFAAGQPAQRVFQLGSAPLDLGRVELAERDQQDSMISRQHARFRIDGTDVWATDLGSHNGTFIAGQRISGPTKVRAGSTIRMGGVLLVAVADVLPFKDYGLGIENGVVAGPALRQALETIAFTQQMGMVTSLLISGGSGSGKEIAAQVFHRAGGKPNAPFAAVNCATIPKDLAERLLFGSRRGAFSGATDAPGHVQAAHGGTLFLDEIAELPPDVQGKLLRMLETREVMRLGATSYESVDVRVCGATWRNLREEVAAGRFREDLYFRIGQPEVRLPSLCERVEEIPWHVQQVLETYADRHTFTVKATFIEECALRAWPGNVRELRAEVRRAAATVGARGSATLGAEDLAPLAGRPIERSELVQSEPTQQRVAFPEDEFASALLAEAGNVVAAARRLGVHRNKVRRWLERYDVSPVQFKR